MYKQTKLFLMGLFINHLYIEILVKNTTYCPKFILLTKKKSEGNMGKFYCCISTFSQQMVFNLPRLLVVSCMYSLLTIFIENKSVKTDV